MSVSRIAVPSAPGRTARTEQMRQSFDDQIKAREAAAEKRKALWSAVNHFCRTNNKGWLVSAPGAPMRFECAPDSELPDLFIDRGFEVQSLGTGTRIEGGKFLPVCIYSLLIPSLGR
jgi:hypothetical protein